MGYDTYMNEDFGSNALSCEAKSDDKLSQYWTVVSASSGKYHLQNMCTQRYITRQNGTLSTQYKTQTSKPTVGFSFTRTSDATNLLYYIVDNGNVALHCDAQSAVVGWYTNEIPGSTWGFEEVELTEEFIENGRSGLKAYNELKTKLTSYKAALTRLFKDYACTELKDEIQELSNEALAENADYQLLNADMQAMILKVKNNSWETCAGTDGYSRDFEKFFRVRDDYQVYSHYQKMAGNAYCGMSNSFGKLSGPTGICGNAGDIIYLYVGAPVSAILYKCRVTETDIPYNYQDRNLTIKALMKIKLLKRYDKNSFTFKVLNDEYGIFAVRGPRGVPFSLSEALNNE